MRRTIGIGIALLIATAVGKSPAAATELPTNSNPHDIVEQTQSYPLDIWESREMITLDCPSDHPYLLRENFEFRILPPGVSVEAPLLVGVSGVDHLNRDGYVIGVKDMSMKNWGPNYAEVKITLHCTGDAEYGYKP